MKPTLALVPLLLSSLLPLARANPVPDEIANRFRNNVLATSREGRCPDSTSLVKDFSSFGLGLLSPVHVKSIEERFDTFAPLIVASQRPGNRHNIHFALQRLYFRNADAIQRAAMLSILREWLNAEISESPASGWGWVSGPPSAVRRAIDVARVMAAEILSDQGDAESLSLMAALQHRGISDTLSAFVLRRAMARLGTPCAMTFLTETQEDQLQSCESLDRIRRVSIAVGSTWKSGRAEHTLDSAQIRDLWRLMDGVRKVPNSGWLGNRWVVLMEFEDGVVASLSPTEPGRLVYSDNTTLDWGRRLTLQSDSLHHRVSEWIRTVERNH